MSRFLLWVSDRLAVRIISRVDGERYLERYFLCKLWRWTFFLHRFRSSDPENEVHDHPWNSISIILSGSYLEYRWLGGEMVVKTCKRFNRVRGETFHRVVLPKIPINMGNVWADHKERECWTLFIHAPQFKPWGFLKSMAIEAGPDEMKFYRYTSMPKDSGGVPWYKVDFGRKGRDIRDSS